jgi:hypothetical protein
MPFVSSEYYRPGSSEGRAIKATCPPDPSFWVIDREDVVVGTRVRSWDSNIIKIDMTFEIPQGNSVRLLSQTLTVTTSGGGTLQGELSGSVKASHRRIRKIEPGEILQGGSRSLFGAGYSPYFRIFNSLYWYSASLDVNQPDQLTIRFPSFLVNGVEQSLPVINFTPNTDFRLLESLNC